MNLRGLAGRVMGESRSFSKLAAPLALASKLFGSSAIAQVAVLVATGIVTTRVRPADFADYGAVSGAAFVIASFNTLAAETRIPVVAAAPARALHRAAWNAIVFLSLAGVIAGGVVAANSPRWSVIVLLTTGCSLLLGIQQILTAVVLREQRQGLLAQGRLVQGLSNAGLLVALIFLPVPGVLVLSGSWFLSLGLGLIPLFKGLSRSETRDWFGIAHKEDWRLLRREVGLQPIANTLTTGVGSMPLLVLPLIATADLSGAWAVVNRFLMPVVNTLYLTLQPLYYGRGAHLLRQNAVAQFREYRASWLKWLSISSVGMLIACIVAIELALPILGSEWRIGSLVTLPACFYYVSLFLCLPVSQTLLMLARVKIQFWWTIARVVLCALPFSFVSWIGAYPALTGWAVAAAVTFVAQLELQKQCIANDLGKQA